MANCKVNSQALRLFNRAIFLVVGVTITLFTVVSAPVMSQDSGAQDTVKLVFSPSPIIGTNLSMAVICSVFVDVDSLQVLQFGWDWDNASLEIDSVVAAPRFDSMEIGPFFYLGDIRQNTNDSQVAICSGVASFNLYPPAAGWRHVATYYMHSSAWTAASAVNVDTVELSGLYGPSTEYLFLPIDGSQYDAVWGGPINFAGCCVGIRGDVNLDGTDADVVDLNYLVNYIFRNGAATPCLQEADVNADGSAVNIVDLNYIVNYIFRSGPTPQGCG